MLTLHLTQTRQVPARQATVLRAPVRQALILHLRLRRNRVRAKILLALTKLTPIHLDLAPRRLVISLVLQQAPVLKSTLTQPPTRRILNPTRDQIRSIIPRRLQGQYPLIPQIQWVRLKLLCPLKTHLLTCI